MGKSRKAPSKKAPPRPSRKVRVEFEPESPDPEDIPSPKRRPRSPVYESRPANPGGVYLPDHEQLVRLIAARGMSDDEIEMIYGLGSGTLKRWKAAYPGLQRAIDEGRTVADSNVLFAMYQTATGYHYEEDQAVGGKEPEVMRVQKYKPGEFAAQKHWLGNRIKRPDGTGEWPRSEQVELSGPRGGSIGVTVESRNDLIDAIIGLVQPKADNERKRTRSDEEESASGGSKR